MRRLAICLALALSAMAQSPVNIAWEGDSITDPNTGFVLSTLQYPYIITRAAPLYLNAKIFAVSGNQVSDLTARQATVNAYFDSAHYSYNILSILIGTNDIVTGGKSAATVYADLKTYCQLMLAAHPWKIVIIAVLPRDGNGTTAAVFNPIRNALNNLIAGDPTFYSYFINPTTEVHVWCDSCSSNPTYYFAGGDNTHPVSAGHAIMATYVSTVVNLIARGVFPQPLGMKQ